MKTIVWDVDDVLNDLMRAWFHGAWKKEQPDCACAYEDILKNPPHQVLGGSRADYLHSLDRFRTDYGPCLEPVPEVLAWFQEHGHKFRHAALTAVPLRSAHVSAEWVMRHFGKWIRSFNVVPSVRPDDDAPVYGLTKGDFLSWWGKADILVDDSIQNVESARAAGVQTLLWPRPWNILHHQPVNVLSILTALTHQPLLSDNNG